MKKILKNTQKKKNKQTNVSLAFDQAPVLGFCRLFRFHLQFLWRIILGLAILFLTHLPQHTLFLGSRKWLTDLVWKRDNSMTVHQENILSSKWRQQKFAVGKFIIIKNTKQEPDRLTTQAQHIEILMWPKDNLKKYDRQNYFKEVHSSLVIVVVKRKRQDTKSCQDFKESFCRPIQNLPPSVHRAARVISAKYNTFIKFNEREKSVLGTLRC